ncbi:hypothetical protein [Falsiroseomonas sp.]|uniref:hypothetical protein n=1 Tax=Falsiroseomonas sp. TaxID=2870721 RepID=UPI0034A10107
MTTVRRLQMLNRGHVHTVVVDELQRSIRRHHQVPMLHITMRKAAAIRLFSKEEELIPQLIERGGVRSATGDIPEQCLALDPTHPDDWQIRSVDPDTSLRKGKIYEEF